MFHRRLLLLLLAATAVMLVLGAATAKLTLGPEQARRQAAAEAALLRPDLIPTVRGRILDRHGRVLAEDEPASDVTVHYSVITGQWAYENAASDARWSDRERWSELDREGREALIDQFRAKYDDQVESLWQTLAELGGTTRQAIEDTRNRVIRRVQAIATSHTANRQRRLTRQRNEDVSWAEAHEPVREQVQHHPILQGIDEATRTRIFGFMAEAQREHQDYLRARREDASTPDTRALQIWRRVDLQRPARRHLPFETMTVMLETANLPGPLREKYGEPVEVTVEGVGLHTIGLMRPAWSREFEVRPFHAELDLGGYMDGDRVGSFGIEAMMEDRLRGARGRKILHLDSEMAEETPAVRGADVRSSLDIQLQARVQAIMSPEIGLMQTQPWHAKTAAGSGREGTPLNGAAVVMDVATGEVLAAVTIPTFTREQLREDADLVFRNQADVPYRNRVLEQPYAPGSTMKPLVLAVSYTDRKLGLDEQVDTPGYLWPNKPSRYRDWIYKMGYDPFGRIDGSFAIARSSNVFFGKMAQRLGPERLVWWYEQFGLGTPPGSGLRKEHPGVLPRDEAIDAGGWEYIAIGQGPVQWTPLQAANAYATLARGGAFMPPTFLADHQRPIERDLELNPGGLDRVFEGMRQSANESIGTTHHLSLLGSEPIFNVEGVTIMAKSGTAQGSPRRAWNDANGNDRPDPGEWGRILQGSTDANDFWGDHAWVAALVQPDGKPSPTHAVVAVVEYAGSGGQVSGPIVNQIVHALKQEGYLD